MCAGQSREKVQRDFLKFTAQRIKDRLKVDDADFLIELFANAKDRKYSRLTGRAGNPGEKSIVS